MMLFSFNRASGRVADAPPVTASPEPVKPKVMIWGEPTWFLLHTLAEKVKPDRFAEMRTELLSILTTICSNLPCPDCANHASNYLRQYRFNSIGNKDQLKLFFFEFHNSVNRRKGYPLFEFGMLEKYKRANLRGILQYFMHHFLDKVGNAKMIYQQLFRQKLVLFLQDWFLAHLDAFEN